MGVLAEGLIRSPYGKEERMVSGHSLSSRRAAGQNWAERRSAQRTGRITVPKAATAQIIASMRRPIIKKNAARTSWRMTWFIFFPPLVHRRLARVPSAATQPGCHRITFSQPSLTTGTVPCPYLLPTVICQPAGRSLTGPYEMLSIE